MPPAPERADREHGFQSVLLRRIERRLSGEGEAGSREEDGARSLRLVRSEPEPARDEADEPGEAEEASAARVASPTPPSESSRLATAPVPSDASRPATGAVVSSAGASSDSTADASPAPAHSIWFEQMTSTERERVVADDLARMDRWQQVERITLLAWRKPILQGAGLFAFFGGFLGQFSLTQALVCLPFGALTGAIWHALHADQVVAPLIGIPIFLASFAISGELGFDVLCFAPMAIGSLSAYFGMRRHELPGC